MKENDPLEQLFSEAKEQQDQVAAAAEMGVEARLEGQLGSAASAEDDLWIGALWRLCTAGGALTACLAIWVFASQTNQPQEITSLLIEQWVFGI